MGVGVIMSWNVPGGARGGGIEMTSSASGRPRPDRVEAGSRTPLRARGMGLECAHTLKVQRE
jgi:hypothetical protein